MEKLKVGVIGTGKMGLLHAGIFNTLEESIVSAISEKKKMIVNSFKQYLPGINIYQNYKEMLEEEDLDVAVITTPVFLHKKMIQDAMKHSLNIFVEKPLAINGGECRLILNKPYKNRTMVGYCRRFMGTYNLAKKIVENSDLGSVNYFHSHLFVAQVFSQGKGWLYDPKKSGGGVLMDLGSHAIDLLHYLFGDIETVHAFGKAVFNKEVEDYVSINMRLKKVPLGSLQLSWSIRNYRLPEFKIEIHLEEGVIVVTEKYINIYSEKETGSIKKGWNTYYKQNLTKDVPVDLGGPEYTLEDLHFLKCVLENKETLCNFREAAKTNFVIDKIYSSIEKEKVERVSYEV
ncbi:MAG TPA: Gfo/Idh/MocA family oxidoreductase [Thermoplasmatales archaeon]|nr:Gfo/Idh/MocA family oxidoreductase [Thermoplasmatales archaeon]